MLPANQPIDSPGLDINTSNLWSGAHTILDTPAGGVLIHGGFTPLTSYVFDPGSLTWTRVDDTAGDRFYATTLTLGDGRAATLYGNVKTIEIYYQMGACSLPVVLAEAAMVVCAKSSIREIPAQAG